MAEPSRQALDRIEHKLDQVLAELRGRRRRKVAAKRAHAEHRAPVLVPVDEVSRARAVRALRRAGL